jgi:putative transposase
MPGSNQRWCSDGFNIKCWNGETVRVAFALDCHDREAIEQVAATRDLNGHDIRLLLDWALWSRFGERTLKSPVEIQTLGQRRRALRLDRDRPLRSDSRLQPHHHTRL